MQCAIEEHNNDPGLRQRESLQIGLKNSIDGPVQLISTTLATANNFPITNIRPHDLDQNSARGNLLQETFGREESLDTTRTRVLEAYTTLSRRRNDHMLLQAQSATEMSAYKFKRKFTEDSILQLVATLSSQREEGMRNVPRQRLDSIKAQLAEDGAQLESQSQITTDVESRSSSTQYMVADAEATFMTALRSFILSMPGGIDLWADMNAAAEQGKDVASQASEELPELAQNYFDAAGDSHILQEQIVELHQEHVEQRGLREFERDQEKEPATPDSTFERRYETEQKTLQKRLEEALRAAKEAKRLCDKDGIDIEALRYRNVEPADDATNSHQLNPFSPYLVTSFGPNLLSNGSLHIDEKDDIVPESPIVVRNNVRNWLANSFDADESAPRGDTRREQNRKANRPALRRYRSETALYFDG